MASEIKPGQVWQSRRKGEESNRVEVLMVGSDLVIVRGADTPAWFARSREIGARTLRKNYQLVKEAP